MLKLFTGRRWDELKAHVRAVSAEEVYEGVSTAGRTAPAGLALDGLVTGPDDVLGLTLAGGFNRYMAWQLRGYATADQTSDSAIMRYVDKLQEAIDDLQAALALDPANGLAASFLASAAAESSPEEKDEIGALLAQSRGAPPSGYMALLNAQAEKWGGSHAKMWETVHRYRDLDKPGTLALVARAHFEHHLYLLIMDERGAAQKEAERYYRDGRRLAELQAASDEVFVQRGPENLHAQRLADGWFARVLIQAGDTRRARRHLVRLGAHVEDWIWAAGSAFGPRLTWGLSRLRAGLLPF